MNSAAQQSSIDARAAEIDASLNMIREGLEGLIAASEGSNGVVTGLTEVFRRAGLSDDDLSTLGNHLGRIPGDRLRGVA